MYFASGTKSMQGHGTSAPSVGNALPPMYHEEDQETTCYKDLLDSWIQMAEYCSKVGETQSTVTPEPVLIYRGYARHRTCLVWWQYYGICTMAL